MRASLHAISLCAAAWASYLTDAELVAFYGRAPARTASPPPLRVPRDTSQTLRAAAAAIGLFVGTALDYLLLENASEPLYASTAAAQFSLVTAENACKWGSTEPKEGLFFLNGCAATLNFTLQHGGVFRNHNLCWGVGNPAYLLNATTTALPGILTEHIDKLGARFGSASYCFDVVNEAVSDSADPAVVFKPAKPWFPALPTYVADAFVAARTAMPEGTKLFYNDYGAEGMGVKSDKVYNLLAGLLSAGVKVDGVGMQMHTYRLVALGLEVHITEMDVRCNPDAGTGSICGADRLEDQARIYGGILGACLANSKPTAPSGRGGCTSLETWGFTDKYTWLWDWENPTHANLQPLPFDVDYAIKPAFTEMLAVLQGP